jgi:hypothetical protein
VTHRDLPQVPLVPEPAAALGVDVRDLPRTAAAGDAVAALEQVASRPRVSRSVLGAMPAATSAHGTVAVCVAAVLGGDPVLATSVADALAQASRTSRVGVGPVLPAGDAASSYARAVLALSLTAAGTPDDPGERVVVADDAGALLDVVAAMAGRGTPGDVESLASAQLRMPWVLETVDALTRSISLREAAKHLHVHHSTLDERLHRLEHVLGWSPATPPGRHRAHLALNLHRNARFRHDHPDLL